MQTPLTSSTLRFGKTGIRHLGKLPSSGAADCCLPTLLCTRIFGTALLLLGLWQGDVLGQASQLSVGRIDDMPDLPVNYLMRDWKAVARGADSLMFDRGARGQYLPLVRFRRPYNGTAFTDSIFGVPSFVGDTRGEGLEGILTLPSVVSGLLVGIDKRDQDGKHYVAMTQDWWSRRDRENVYLNLPLTSSGQDWWYETMPNVFFQHIYSLAAPYGDAERHFTEVATQWSRVVTALGGSTTPWQAGNFNYRSFRIRDMRPVSGGVPEPEAAGAIGYLLENAWRKTGEVRYRYAAEQALEYLNGLTQNPSYELQLYYGVQAAARMNALEGTTYDVGKMLGWSLSRGPLRGWGVSVATAGDYGLHGLVGETERGNDYLFFLNGVQAVAALAPIARYDNRYARTIGKYILHVANNSRLFYGPFLPAAQQSSAAWSSEYDPKGYLAYEAIRQSANGQQPYATGDAKRLGWAPTDIGLYGTASSGYLAAIVDSTNVPGILALDLNATDFLGPKSYPTQLVYNPHDVGKEIEVPRPLAALGSRELYDAVSNQVFLYRQEGPSATIYLPADEARVITWIPAGTSYTYRGSALYGDDVVIDYSSDRLALSFARIKAAEFEQDTVSISDTVRLHLTGRSSLSPSRWSLEHFLPRGLEFISSEALDAERTVMTFVARDVVNGDSVLVLLSNPAGEHATVKVPIWVVLSSSIGDGQQVLAKARAWPNPAEASAVVRLDLPDGNYQVEALDGLGRRSALRSNHASSGDAGVEVQLGDLPAGIYSLIARKEVGGQGYVLRLVVLGSTPP